MRGGTIARGCRKSGPVNQLICCSGLALRVLKTSTYAVTRPPSPDGRLIAFDIDPDWDEFRAVGLVTAEGSDDQHIVVNMNPAWAPAWSPDGSQIAFVTGLPGGIGVVGADGSGQRQLLAGHFRDVDWTPDGRLIFTRAMTANTWEGPSRVFISDGGERQLIPDATPARQIYRDWQVAWLR